MTTLVVCLDRTDDVGRKTGLRSPIVGWEAVRALVTDIGLADPEDSGVNSLLETLRVAQDLRDDGEDTVVAVVSGDRESMVSADRAVARQLDDLIADHDPDSAVVVIDSAEDERLVPIVESRVQVDSVDRVVVRQARDIESTYYLLKQFLADEELRQTVLVPLGLTLLVFPILAMQLGAAEGAAAITTVIGLFLLYKGLNVDEMMSGVTHQAREALYSGQVSVVTYVVAAGLTLVGVFAGALGVSSLEDTQTVLVPTMQFVFDSVPWFAMAGITASAGRLLDEAISEDPVRQSYLNLPFILLAVALVLRGFSAYFLEQQGVISPLAVPTSEFGRLSIEGFTLAAGERLALFVATAIAVSLVGARAAVSLSGTDDLELVEEEPNAESGSGTELTDGGPGPVEPNATGASDVETVRGPGAGERRERESETEPQGEPEADRETKPHVNDDVTEDEDGDATAASSTDPDPGDERDDDTDRDGGDRNTT
ncbi:DUF373 family protein [Halobiforma nitratireducens]|uniref:DUF373 family protein n=1 Tax=Halobiforma nitratireducens JCM 10879 TaxID=1227454 RepID=M0MBK2_9EURY|nr:DUF373 family protein [Halobiforma nitratireducens]EMA41785.1 hypothetical protein C446_05700 [Halobiforma nitratireducens JCM 10879]